MVIKFRGFDEAIQELIRESDEMRQRIPRAVSAGAEAAKAILQEAAPVGKTGQLADSITISPEYRSFFEGVHRNIFPDGTRSDGERNATVGYVHEYGRSNMPPSAWMSNAIEEHGETVQAAVAGELTGGDG